MTMSTSFARHAMSELPMTVLSLLAGAAIYVCTSSTASASQPPNSYAMPAGGCAKGETKRTSPGTGGRPTEHWCILPKDKKVSGSSSGGSSSSASKFPERMAGDVFDKPSALVRCPSGYYSSSDLASCGAQFDGMPKVSMKAGSCPSGTVEEWGAYCTSVPAEASDELLDRMSGSTMRDYNVVVNHAMRTGGPRPNVEEKPEVYKQLLAKREADGNPWKPRWERERAAQTAAAQAKSTTPASASAPAATAEAPAATNKDAENIGKAIGAAIKLFGR